MERLYDKLKAYSESDFYAFHMPGHKRNKALLGIELPYDLDITEIDGFDDLHHADGILKEEQERAARVFGAEESHFLVNGSTAGILSAVMGCTHRGDKILVARHCHKSIYHAIYMNGLVPRYVYPEFDISKVVISTANANITSPELADRLRKEYHLEMEMTGGTYVLAMTTVADTQEGLDRLKAALLEIDGQLEAKTAVSGSIEISGELPRLEQYFIPQEAADREEDGEAEEIPWKESEGHISLEYAYLYPPGSPVIVPGERISREAVELLCYYETQNLQIEGIQTEGKIKVWKHE